MNRPEVRYAALGESYIAYQIIGDGPVDLVYQSGFPTHVDLQWDVPEIARFLGGIASFSRLIVFDHRGFGLSDPVDIDNVTLEGWMEDTTAVMDAVASERAVLVGTCESGPMQILFSATHPARTAGLVLINTWACGFRTKDYPWGIPERARDAMADNTRKFMLGENDELYRQAAPGRLNDERFRESFLRILRAATSPGMVAPLLRLYLSADVREILPSVRSPTLILHNIDQGYSRIDHGRYLAKHLPGAKYLELPGSGIYPWIGDVDSIVAEIEEFVTGVRPMHEPNRVLATVLFTDLVSSTQRAAEIGDRRWRELLEAHNRAVRGELERHRGREVSTAGDSFLATFDGPARAVRCACSIVDGVRELGLEVRAGVHTGEIELVGDDVAGIAVNIGSRVSGLAGPGEVLVSRTVTDLVAGSGLSFSERGSHALKGVPGEWQLYAVER